MECLSARRCRIGGIAGDGGTSSVVRVIKSDVLVLRLSWLGFLFMVGILGLMKDGEEGSETSEWDEVGAASGGWMDNPFMFRGLLGEGEVMGRAKPPCPMTLSVEVLFECIPNDVAGKLLRGIKLTGESGEDEGEGSDRGEESVVDKVVVGEESADSDIWVEVLSWCLWVGSSGRPPPRRGCCEGFIREGAFEPISASLWSTTVTVSRSAMVSASRSNTDMKEGI